MAPAVNGHRPRRRYDASGRRARAAARRETVLNAARHQLLADGFVATTLAGVAAEAGVSVESIYKSFGSKAGLLKAVWHRSLAGSAPTHAELRSDAGSRAAQDGVAIIRNWARLAVEVGAVADPSTASWRVQPTSTLRSRSCRRRSSWNARPEWTTTRRTSSTGATCATASRGSRPATSSCCTRRSTTAS